MVGFCVVSDVGGSEAGGVANSGVVGAGARFDVELDTPCSENAEVEMSLLMTQQGVGLCFAALDHCRVLHLNIGGEGIASLRPRNTDSGTCLSVTVLNIVGADDFKVRPGQCFFGNCDGDDA